MDNAELHTAHSDGDEASSSVYAPAIRTLMRSLLSALADIDFAYERERERVSRTVKDAGLRMRLLKGLSERHRERRDIYVQQLTTLQAEIRKHNSGMTRRLGGRVTAGSCGACLMFEFPKDKHWRTRLYSQFPGRCRTTSREVYRDQPACESYRCRVEVAGRNCS
jgi:hypothetical protein